MASFDWGMAMSSFPLKKWRCINSALQSRPRILKSKPGLSKDQEVYRKESLLCFGTKFGSSFFHGHTIGAVAHDHYILKRYSCIKKALVSLLYHHTQLTR